MLDTPSIQTHSEYFDILLIVHLNIFILISTTKFYNKFISCLYMFGAHLLIVRRSKLYYTVSGIITPIGGHFVSQPVHGTDTYRCDDTRDCVVQFCPPDDEHLCSKHVEDWNKLIIKFSSCWLVLRQIYSEYVKFIDFQNQIYIHERSSLSRSTYTHCLSCLIYIYTFISHHREHSVIPLERPVHLITLINVQTICMQYFKMSGFIVKHGGNYRSSCFKRLIAVSNVQKAVRLLAAVWRVLTWSSREGTFVSI